MGKKSHDNNQTKPVQVTYRQTGETKFVDAPVSKKIEKESEVTVPLPHIANSLTALTSTDVPSLQSVGNALPEQRVKKVGEKRDIQSIKQFVECYFSGKIKSLPEKLARQISTGPALVVEQRFNLIDQALRSDFILDRTRQLFLLGMEVGGNMGLKRVLCDFARDVVMHHPAMMQEDAFLWFPHTSQDDHATIGELWKRVTGFQYPVMSKREAGIEGQVEWTKSVVRKARQNAFLSAVIWRRAVGELSLTELVRSLRFTLYRPSVESRKVEANLLKCLLTTPEKERSGIADLVGWLSEQSAHAHAHAQVIYLQSQVDLAQQEKREAERLTLEGKDEINDLIQQLAALRTKFDAAIEDLRILKVHNRDDLSRLRSRSLRVLEEELPVLSDCVVALNREPPKIAIAKEYLQTALDKLNQELRALKES